MTLSAGTTTRNVRDQSLRENADTWHKSGREVGTGRKEEAYSQEGKPSSIGKGTTFSRAERRAELTSALAAEVRSGPRSICIVGKPASTRKLAPQLQRTHVRQELPVRLRFAQLVDQQLHRFHRRQRVQHLAQH